MTFDDMVRQTMPHWERLARHIAHRWRGPTWYGVEDLQQEILFAAWKAVWDWDPTRGVTIARYVVYNAVSAGKKRLHRARGASLHRNSDAAPSNFELPVLDAFPPGSARAGVQPADQGECIERLENALSACVTRVERTVVRALAREGCPLRAAVSLHEDRRARCALGASSQRETRLAVWRTAEAVAERMMVAS